MAKKSLKLILNNHANNHLEYFKHDLLYLRFSIVPTA